MIRSVSIALFCITCLSEPLLGQAVRDRADPTTYLKGIGHHLNTLDLRPSLQSAPADSGLPDPQSVMFKSMMIPGWGQIVNRQAWKVPIVYGLIGGLAGYSVYLTKQYHDYRAAYYNLNPNTPDDLRFGPTPASIPPNANLESLRHNRDQLRNRRDLIYVTVVLAHGLNIVDAYVFAHMRSFDVSEDLSLRTTVKPGVTPFATPGVTLSVELFRK